MLGVEAGEAWIIIEFAFRIYQSRDLLYGLSRSAQRPESRRA